MASATDSGYFQDGAYLNVDMRSVSNKIDWMRTILDKDTIERLIYRTFGEVGRKSRKLIADEVVDQYAVQKTWVRGGIGTARTSISGGAFPVTCKIPLSGVKGLGARSRIVQAKNKKGQAVKRYKWSGEFKAYQRKGKIDIQILRSRRSTLPEIIKNRGGNKPFFPKGASIIFTRRTKARLPIVRVASLSVPQMPLNRSESDVAKAILTYCGDRLEHNFYHMLGRGGQ